MQTLPRLRPARWLMAVIPMIISGFVAAHIVTVSVARNLHRQAQTTDQITERSNLLSEVRGELHRMGMANGRALGQAEIDARFDHPAFEQRKRRIAAIFARLDELPASPAEAELTQKVQQAVIDAAAAIARTVALVEGGDRPAAHAVDSMSLVRSADDAIQRVIDLNTEQVRSESRQIAETDRRIKLLAPVFDAIAAAFALVLMALAAQAARQYARMSEERNRLAEQRAEELDSFAGRVAHDLQNPLGALALRAALAHDRFADPQVREEISRLRGNVDRMSGLIEGLLEFARAGGRPQPGARGELVTVLDQLLADFIPDAESAGAALAVEPFLPVAVACPPGPLSSVLANLLRNAVKYVVDSPAGARRIQVRVSERASSVRIEVADTGPGIAPGMERAIFEPFVRAGSGKQPGIGLGLATVKRIVEAYGGRVGVESQPGAGARFWFELAPVSAARHLGS